MPYPLSVVPGPLLSLGRNTVVMGLWNVECGIPMGDGHVKRMGSGGSQDLIKGCAHCKHAKAWPTSMRAVGAMPGFTHVNIHFSGASLVSKATIKGLLPAFLQLLSIDYG
eukprot:scaffold179926_cov16-Tisochrysis_lutea.AAC.1